VVVRAVNYRYNGQRNSNLDFPLLVNALCSFMERREFIKKLLLRGGVGVGASAALAGYYQPRQALYRHNGEGEALKERLDRPKKVVVVGGGLAGISASLELASRGFAVTLVESSASLGGKLTGWEIEALGEKFPVEHGFHGFFEQYYNLKEMFASAGVTPNVFSASPGYPIIFKNSPEEIFGQASKYFPLNVFSMWLRFSNMTKVCLRLATCFATSTARVSAGMIRSIL
jgi:isorenieratene synthase